MILMESLLLALMACAAGALLSVWLLAAAKALMPSSAQFDWAFEADSRVLVAAFLLAAFAGVSAGLAPAFESFRTATGGMRSPAIPAWAALFGDRSPFSFPSAPACWAKAIWRSSAGRQAVTLTAPAARIRLAGGH
jgi:hypothetical protein